MMSTRATEIHSNQDRRHQPFAVLVFPLLDGRIVWVKHPVRGWEPPGGKVEPGESAEEAAEREVYEESGARLCHLRWIAEYAVPAPDGSLLYKWVYTADVEDIGARPDGSETVDVGWMPAPVNPAQIRARGDVSYILKDDVFEFVWPAVAARLAAEKNRTVR